MVKGNLVVDIGEELAKRLTRLHKAHPLLREKTLKPYYREVVQRGIESYEKEAKI